MKNKKGKERHGPEEGEEDLTSESDDDNGSNNGCDRVMVWVMLVFRQLL
jgi:hypothetical protein